MEGVEPTHSHEYQILSLARLPIPPHRLPGTGGISIGHGLCKEQEDDLKTRGPSTMVGT